VKVSTPKLKNLSTATRCAEVNVVQVVG